ncbi:MAG: hypothetical protein AMXMBFR84_48900 [Candidatus Hydrogenedentota bacterium]
MGMGKKEAEQRFKASDTLYKEGKFADALIHLDALNKAFPSTRNVLYPRAGCLYRLGRYDEAAEICDELSKRFQDKRADRLRQQINAKRFNLIAQGHTPDSTDIDSLSADLGDLFAPAIPPPAAPKEPIKEGPDWKKIGLIGGGILAVALLLIIPLLLAPERAPEPAASGSQATAESDAPIPMIAMSDDGELVFFGYAPTMLGWFLVGFSLQLFHYTLTLFLTLMATNKLPDGTLGEVILNCMIVSGICALISTIPSYFFRIGGCFSFFINMSILRSNYDMGFVDFIVLYAIGLVTGFLILLVIVGIGIAFGFAAMASATPEAMVTILPRIFHDFVQ